MKKHTMLLLWLGASISISEIYTGGLLAPLGFARGIAVILVGHLIGTGLLALGSRISFSRKENAMDSAAFSLGGIGGKLAALCNVVQLIGWTIVMVVQAGSAVTGVFPDFPFRAAALILSSLVLLWALILGSPAGRLNEIAVILLSALCVLLFAEAARKGLPAGGLGAAMSVSLGIELSIAMPVSWLPLAGDYASKTDSPACATLMPFIGYFTGSVLMYGFGLFIALSSGGDIFAFIAGSSFRFAACAVVVLSTMTTAFLDLYSAAVSSRQFIRGGAERRPVLVIGLFALAVSVFFPVGKYEAFLTAFLSAIGMVFVPIYSVIFLDYLLKRKRFGKALHIPALAVIVIGMAAYRVFTRFEIWIPTVLTILTVWALYLPFALPGRKAAPGGVRRGKAGHV
ncbi:MAG: permease [Treponema sp.]|jgi:putative hydroxymethylpyrimidine transporter CytX|nr:permease [Treponema sp.]